MADARARFFDHMERELLDSVNDNNDDVDFSITESGRTVVDMALSARGDDLMNDVDRAVLKALDDDENGGEAPTRAIPIASKQQTHPASQHASSQPSSHGSSGSAFLSSVLNPQQMLAHTPPVMASSYEASHFGKRARSGSVSGRLRSASEYLEDRGLLDRQTKSLLKDLIIIGDEELQRALDKYDDDGDPSLLEEMICSGALQNRLPPDLDLLGDLDLDFLTMNDSSSDYPPVPPPAAVAPPVASEPAMTETTRASSNMVSPPYDDGIGDLEFNDFGEYMQISQPQQMSNVSSAAGSPVNESSMSEYERRMRSNSLFSALLNDGTRSRENSVSIPGVAEGQYGRWMEESILPTLPEAPTRGIQIKKPPSRRLSAPNLATGGGIGESLKQADSKKKTAPKKKKDELMKDADEPDEHIPGSGRPRTLSDPNLQASTDEFGLRQVERPDGWVGAYSPESRRVRIDRFLEKRNHRVWSKTIKYDVRKNFADSRLRVKGRFVRKEDELLMRELMSLT